MGKFAGDLWQRNSFLFLLGLDMGMRIFGLDEIYLPNAYHIYIHTSCDAKWYHELVLTFHNPLSLFEFNQIQNSSP